MTESCYGATFVAGLERQLACAYADKKLLAERLAAAIGERDDLVAQHEEDIQGQGSLNAPNAVTKCCEQCGRPSPCLTLQLLERLP